MLTDEAFVERFWNHVDRRDDNECWPFTGYRMANGYGMSTWPIQWWRDGLVGARRTTAHRIACYLAGKLPNPADSDMFVLHSCDNRICCNPAHLRAGTHEENMRDMDERGRRNNEHITGERSPHAKLTEAAVREIRRAVGVPRKILADRYGVSLDSIWAVIGGRTWRHVA